MSQIAEKLRGIAREIVADGRPLGFFAAFLPDDSPGVWDVVVSAPWAVRDRSAAIHYIVRKLHATLTRPELMKIAGVIVLDKTPAPLAARLGSVDIEENVTASDVEINDITVRAAYVFVLKLPRVRKQKLISRQVD
jgi:hypothetical protein